ncbi:MAG: hypothetical protein L0I76_34995 [Pseudonocardia sp.]|nr:hypothetical protein [Pseudonocardia sp.]
MTGPEQLAPEVQALALAALAKQIKALDPVVRATFAHDYENGDGRTFRSPLDGRKLGKVRRNDPDPEWRVTDADALLVHLRGRGHVETVHDIVGGDDEVAAVLAVHAPHLLAEVTRVPPSASAAVLAATRKAGEPVGPDGEPVPGVELKQPAGSLVVTVDPATGADAAADLARAGRLDWSLRPEIGAGRPS